MNRVNFSGNVGADPDVRYSTYGKQIVTFNLAVRDWRDKDKETNWAKIICFGKTAEVVAENVKKGDKITNLWCRYQNRKWKDKDGKDRWSTEFICDEIEFDSRSDDTCDRGGNYQSSMGQDVPFAPCF